MITPHLFAIMKMNYEGDNLDKIESSDIIMGIDGGDSWQRIPVEPSPEVLKFSDGFP